MVACPVCGCFINFDLLLRMGTSGGCESSQLLVFVSQLKILLPVALGYLLEFGTEKKRGGGHSFPCSLLVHITKMNGLASNLVFLPLPYSCELWFFFRQKLQPGELAGKETQ